MDRDADRPFTRYIGIVANSSPDDRGIGTAKLYLIRSVAAV